MRLLRNRVANLEVILFSPQQTRNSQEGRSEIIGFALQRSQPRKVSGLHAVLSARHLNAAHNASRQRHVGQGTADTSSYAPVSGPFAGKRRMDGQALRNFRN
jgi:hypothetical protein